MKKCLIISLITLGMIAANPYVSASASGLFPDSEVLNFQAGRDYFYNGEFQKAVEYLKKSANIAPNVETYMYLGLSYSNLHQYENAIASYSKAIELNPNLTEAYVQRAKACGDIGNYKCSLENYEKLKQMFPDNPFYYHATSIYKSNTKDAAGAMKDIDTAIKMSKKPKAMFYSQKA